MKSILSFLFSFIAAHSFSQMNISQIKSQLPALQLPFDCPTNIPSTSWGDEELNLSDYPYIKKDISALYVASGYASGEPDRYLGIGYLAIGKSIALVYLWESVSKFDGMYRYSIRLDTYDEKGEFVDHSILHMESYESLHEYDPNYEGSPENFNEVIHGSLYASKNSFYIKRDSESSVIRIVEITNGEEYDTENLLLTKTNQFDLLELLPSGKISPVYNEEE